MWLSDKIAFFIKSIIDFIFPPLCLGCNQEIDSGFLCANCSKQIFNAYLGVCAKCGYPVGYNERCQHCKTGMVLPRTRALGYYTPPLLPLIHALKYEGKKSLVKILGRALAGLLNSDPILRKADAIVPIPLHPARERERGFNQAFLLGLEIAQLTGIPLVNVLKRKKNTKSQTQLVTEERILNMQGAFSLKDQRIVNNQKIVLIDDVITSGATINSAAQTLLSAGAGAVYGLVIARA